MPVSKAQFEQGAWTDSLDEMVLAFLKAHPESAFTVLELGQALLNWPRIAEEMVASPTLLMSQAMSLGAVLFALQEERKVRSAFVEGDAYYHLPPLL